MPLNGDTYEPPFTHSEGGRDVVDGFFVNTRKGYSFAETRTGCQQAGTDLAIFERQQAGIMSLTKVDNKYMLLGGVIGAFITWTVITSMSSLGPAKAVLAIVICQLLVAYLIELLGWFGVEKVDFQWSKLIGIVVSIVGFIIFKWEK